MTVKVLMFQKVGSFAESKEIAKTLRNTTILPNLKQGKEVELDFKGVNLGTQSFIHALIADAVRLENPDGLDNLTFSNCNNSLQSLIEVVVSYLQDDWSSS